MRKLRLLLLLLIIVACQKENKILVIQTNEPDFINDSIYLNGDIKSVGEYGILEYGFILKNSEESSFDKDTTLVIIGKQCLNRVEKFPGKKNIVPSSQVIGSGLYVRQLIIILWY